MPGNCVFVTGASGFIGQSLVPRLADAGYRVRAAARDPSHLHFQRTDIETVKMPELGAGNADWSKLVEGCDYVVHLAGIAHAGKTICEADYRSVNCEAVRSLALAAKHAGVKRVIYISSVRAQTGPVAHGIINEATQPRPSDAYGRAKLAGEGALADALEGSTTDWVTLRPVLVYGPGVKGNMAALLRLARRPVPLPLGSLKGRRSILSVENLSSAVVHTIKSPASSRQVFLVADLAPMQAGEIVTAMRKGLKQSAGIVSIPSGPLGLVAKLLGKGEAWARLNGDLIVSTEALRESGWKPVVGSSKALADMARLSIPKN